MSTGAKLQSWITRQWQSRGLIACLLQPLSWLYGRVAKRRRHAYLSGNSNAYRASVPVIVIGNIYVGGTGKTPLACAMADILRRNGWRPGLVSRGYGRASDSLALGQGQHLNWREFGDEPALIALKTGMPIGVHRDRGMAARALLERFTEIDIIISDDGLQHYGLQRDFEVLVQDDRGIGNGLLLPAGPLREPASRLDEVDLVLTRQALVRPAKQPAFSVEISGFWRPATGERLGIESFIEQIMPQGPVIAAAGIGVPQRFFDSLQRLGIELSQTYPLADHAPIDSEWLSALPGTTILITEKDAVKLTPNSDQRLWVCETSVHWWRNDIDAYFVQALAAAGIKHSEL